MLLGLLSVPGLLSLLELLTTLYELWQGLNSPTRNSASLSTQICKGKLDATSGEDEFGHIGFRLVPLEKLATSPEQ